MDGKEFYEKTEGFAKKIICLVADEGLTVRAADTAKAIADYSTVDKESVENPDYPSQHIAVPVSDEKWLFGG